MVPPELGFQTLMVFAALLGLASTSENVVPAAGRSTPNEACPDQSGVSAPWQEQFRPCSALWPAPRKLPEAGRFQLPFAVALSEP